ncbi:MAG: hypothetical protein ABSH50_11855 [Bryobacteraceae bacterium]|jgi:hypothetical protein
MKKLEPGDASALSMLALYPDERTKIEVFDHLSPEGKKIAEAMVSKKSAPRSVRRGQGKPVRKNKPSPVASTAKALLSWSS